MSLFALWFQVKMLLEYNLLLVTTLKTCQLIIFVFLMAQLHAISKNVLVIIGKKYKKIANFKCLQNIFYKR